jgi:DNA-binding NarL/FixJ family response regulator
MPTPPKSPRKKTTTASSKKTALKKNFQGKRIVIVDDHPLIRRGLERMIHTTDGFSVCGEASNAREALAVITKEKPDLAIVDVGLPDSNGIDLTRTLVAKFPRLTVLILSMHEEPSYARRALKAGARGYMVKHDAVEKIHVALNHVLAGGQYLSPRIAAEMKNDP